uniref:Ubiquitin-like protease family profile domain-containing protein n=1 Tax=Setaria italica TaxID=4555 RepID=K4A0X4_SETIT
MSLSLLSRWPVRGIEVYMILSLVNLMKMMIPIFFKGTYLKHNILRFLALMILMMNLIILIDDQNDFNIHLYQEVIADYKKFKMLQNKMKITGFAKVIKNLTSNQRKVIENYGFGSLLLFDKCFVPNNFVKWVARLVDYKSGVIVVNGKIISLTKESMHNILGIPLGGRSFPTDIANGKSVVLKKFNKESIPSVEFFTNKLQSKEEVMFDEDTFICFILIALNSFLCSNASLIPSQKYFGIFDDISNYKELDWCGYILSWLLKHIKTFNEGKTKAGKQPGTLGGCLYYLAVMYFDHVDFGFRCVDDTLPRITVWKGNMIQTYSNFDLKSPGVYGFRPILDFSETCYVKSIHLLNSKSSISDDSEFLEKINSVSGCKLPTDLKTSICKAIEKHTFNLGLQESLEIKVLGEKTLTQNVRDMIRKLDEMCNLKFCASGASLRTPIRVVDSDFHGPESSSDKPSARQPYLSRDSPTGGKLPLHGPRRVVKPSTLFHGEFQTAKQKISVSNSKLKNYKSLCSLASSKFSNEDVVCLGKVRCAFLSLGESLKPGGFVNPFIISTYCYSLYVKSTGTSDTSKSHFFANIGENLLKESEQLFFPTLYNNHWFVFVVNIKDHNFVFLDSYTIKIMNFLKYVDSRIYAMMFLEHWKSPRSVLCKVFNSTDIPSIRVKIANDLIFVPGNSGMKSRVLEYDV